MSTKFNIDDWVVARCSDGTTLTGPVSTVCQRFEKETEYQVAQSCIYVLESQVTLPSPKPAKYSVNDRVETSNGLRDFVKDTRSNNGVHLYQLWDCDHWLAESCLKPAPALYIRLGEKRNHIPGTRTVFQVVGKMNKQYYRLDAGGDLQAPGGDWKYPVDWSLPAYSPGEIIYVPARIVGPGPVNGESLEYLVRLERNDGSTFYHFEVDHKEIQGPRL